MLNHYELTSADFALWCLDNDDIRERAARLAGARAPARQWRDLAGFAIEHCRSNLRPVRVVLAPGLAASAGRILSVAFRDFTDEAAPELAPEPAEPHAEPPQHGGGSKVPNPTPPPVKPRPSERLTDAQAALANW